jgi:uncharacterized membrane protein YidH (DUF202 family)
MEEIGKDLAKELLTTLKSAKAFAIEQAPDVVRQLLAWKYALAVTQTIAALVVLLAIGLIVRKTARYVEEQKKREKYFNADSVWFPVAMGCGTVGIIDLIVLVEGALDWLQLHFAPKVYLIEYLSHLVSK